MKPITREEAAELSRLYGEWAAATSDAFAALKAHGMDSEAFLEADRRAGAIWQRIREIGGLAGKHWTT